MRSDFSFNTAINFNRNDPGSRRSRRQRLDVGTIACCVRHALGCGGRVWPICRRVCCWRPDVYHRHVFFFVCGEILGQSDVLIGLFVFLLGLKKKVISL